MRSSANHSTKHSEDGVESKPRYEATIGAKNQNRGQPAYNKQALPMLSPSPLQAFKPTERFTPLRLPINKVFNAIKDQLWVRHLKPIQYDLALLKAEEYCSHHNNKGQQKPPKVAGRARPSGLPKKKMFLHPKQPPDQAS